MSPFTEDPNEAPSPRSTQRRAELGLYNAAFTYVWAALRRFDIPEQDREDLALAILAAAYEKRRDYEPVLGSPARWLHGFVVNFARRYWERRPQGAQLSIDEVPEAFLATSRPEEQGMAEEQRDFLYKELLARLPFDQRAVVIARDLDELDFKDIARLQEIPLATAYDRYERAHATLVLLYARWKKEQEKKGLAMVFPVTLAQLFAADHALPEAPAELAHAVWKRLQRARRWAPLRAFFRRPWVRMTLSMIVGAALHALLQPAPRERITIVQVPVAVAATPELRTSPAVESSAPTAPSTAPPSVPPSATPAAAVRPSAAPAKPVGSVSFDPLEEQRIFEIATQAFKRGDLDAARASLDRLARAYPHGALAIEREQLRIRVLAQSARDAEAPAKLDRLRATPEGEALGSELDRLLPGPDGGGATAEP